MKQVSRQFELSYKTIVFTVIFLLSLWVVYTIRDILLQVFVALLITAILDPLTTKLLKYGVSRSASILLVYLLAIAMVTFVTKQPSLLQVYLPFYKNSRFPRMLAVR
jgi:predicted PurR-regulated permease PerM